MSQLRRKKRAQQRKDTESLKHLQKVHTMARQLVDSKVLKVYPEEAKALFPRQIWDSKDALFRKNLTRNIALYLLSLNVKEDPEAVMEVELFDFELNRLATYRDERVTLH